MTMLMRRQARKGSSGGGGGGGGGGGSSFNDEMVTSGTGYDPAKWTVHNATAGTIVSDASGALFQQASIYQWVWLERSFDATSGFEFIAKIKQVTRSDARKSYVGLALASSVTLSGGNPYFKVFGMGWNDSAAYFLTFDGYSDTDSNNTSYTQSGSPQLNPQDWWYYKVSGPDATHVNFDISADGTTWTSILSNISIVAVDLVRIQVQYSGSLPAPAYCRYFHRTV